MTKEEPPFSFDSVNRLHDAVEMFLALAAQANEGTIGKDFMDYWRVLEVPLGRPLGYKAQMQRFNKLRVNLKHYGIEPPQSEIAVSRDTVVALLTNECRPLFGIELEEISLSMLIKCQRAQSFFREAEEAWPVSQLEALGKLAQSFQELLRDYENRKLLGYSKSQFRNVERLTSPERCETGDSEQRAKSRDRLTFDRTVIASLESLDSTLTLLTFGVDFRKHTKFMMLTPEVQVVMTGKVSFYSKLRREATTEEYEFCRDFVLQTALRFSEFDYDSDWALSDDPAAKWAREHR
jgi:hypothetical protein